MRLYKKEGDTLKILCFPGEEVEKGDYLAIEEDGRCLLVQVIDTQFANIPGMLEELLRDLAIRDVAEGEDVDALDVGSHLAYIQDARLLVCKVRGALKAGRPTVERWLPSRVHSKIRSLKLSELLDILGLPGELPIELGWGRDGSHVSIDAKDLDGRLNIITGKKGTGKSHLSKLLALGLVDYGATVVILDLNGEYVNLGYTPEGEKNEYYDRIVVLRPGENFRVSLAQTSLKIIMGILVHTFGLPGTSAREFRRIWSHLKAQNNLSMKALGEAIRVWKCNELVRDALYSRYYALVSSGFFTDDDGEAVDLADVLKRLDGGGLLIVNLRDLSPSHRRMVVEYVLEKLVELLSSWDSGAIFLFAEEAHLYMRETYWDDVITRMRHLGVFTTFITNQPDSLGENVYRQADNIFLFNFTNQRDLEMVSRASSIDAETVKLIANELPPHHCLILGYVVRDHPVVVKVRALNVQTMGRTRLFFASMPIVRAARSSASRRAS